jgi:hypothetical protein
MESYKLRETWLDIEVALDALSLNIYIDGLVRKSDFHKSVFFPMCMKK